VATTGIPDDELIIFVDDFCMAPGNVLVREYELRIVCSSDREGKAFKGYVSPNLPISYMERCKRRVSLYGYHTSVLYGEPTAEL
jgi:hypothetical protein